MGKHNKTGLGRVKSSLPVGGGDFLLASFANIYQMVRITVVYCRYVFSSSLEERCDASTVQCAATLEMSVGDTKKNTKNTNENMNDGELRQRYVSC